MKCNLCSGTIFAKTLTGRDQMYNKEGQFTLVKCTRCGLQFLNPQPKDISKHYPKEYYSISTKAQRNRFSEFVYSTYFSDKGRLLIKALLYPIYPLLRGAKVEPGKKILDIGCGSGTFLSRMKNLGMEVAGIDPFIKKNIPELNIKKTTIQKAGFRENTFDVITMNNVLEHVSDPDNYFKHIQKILKPSGVAIIGVPNINGILFKIFRQNWAELDLPRHLYHFNRQTLKQYCRKNKLALTKTRYNSVPFEFTGSIFYFLNSFRKNRKPLSESRMNKSKVFALLMLPFCHIISWLRTGGRIEVYITKKI